MHRGPRPYLDPGRLHLFDQKVRMTLKEIEKNKNLDSVNEGEMFVCTTCAYPLKPCHLHPSLECRDKILGGTYLHALVQRARDDSNGFPAACSICGRELTARELTRNALRELCPSCQARSARNNAGRFRRT